MQDALEVRIAHPDFLHVIEGVADVIDAGTASADSLGHEACAPMQVELAHVRRMLRVGDERERANRSRPDAYRYEARLVDASRHFAIPQACEGASQARRVDAVGHAPAGAAAAQAHHQARLALCAAVARRQDAERTVVAVRAAEHFLRVVEAG